MVGIITDSTCDIPEEFIEQYGIIVISQMVISGEEQLRDRIVLQPKGFYERLASDPVRSHSSLLALGVIQNAFQESIQRGADQLVVVTVSRAMSGTYELVKNAAQSINIPVSMVDAKGPKMRCSNTRISKRDPVTWSMQMISIVPD